LATTGAARASKCFVIECERAEDAESVAGSIRGAAKSLIDDAKKSGTDKSDYMISLQLAVLSAFENATPEVDGAFITSRASVNLETSALVAAIFSSQTEGEVSQPVSKVD
jgi:hypothetical protein